MLVSETWSLICWLIFAIAILIAPAPAISIAAILTSHATNCQEGPSFIVVSLPVLAACCANTAPAATSMKLIMQKTFIVTRQNFVFTVKPPENEKAPEVIRGRLMIVTV